MNKFDDIMYRAGLTADGCWEQLDEYDKAAILTFGELIVEECVAIAKSHIGRMDSGPRQIAADIESAFDDPQEETKESVYDRLVAAGIIRPNERELVGEERDAIAQALLHLVPYQTTNNQRYMTEYFDYGGMKYEVTYMEDGVYVIEIDPTWKASK